MWYIMDEQYEKELEDMENYDIEKQRLTTSMIIISFLVLVTIVCIIMLVRDCINIGWC